MNSLKSFLSLCLIPCAGLLIVSGCGSGGGTSPVTPIAIASATPSPVSSPCSTSVDAVLTTGLIPEPRFEVTWTSACGVDEADILEYHVFRGNELVGVTARSVRTFYDGTLFTNQIIFQRPLRQGETPFTTANLVTETPLPVPYNYSASIITNPGLKTDVAAVTSLTTAPHPYNITVVYQRRFNNTLEYVESPVGTSPIVLLPSQ